MKKIKKRGFLLFLFLVLVVICFRIIYFTRNDKTDINDEVIDSAKMKSDVEKENASVEIVGDFATKERLIALINRKKILVYQSNGEQLDDITNLKFIDIDHDGTKEIFISVDTRKNEYPRELFFILKKEQDTYKVLHIKYPKAASKEGFEINAVLNDDMTSILIQRSKNESIFSIPVEEHYRKDKTTDSGETIYEAFEAQNPKPNMIIGGQTNLFDFKFITKKGKDYVRVSQYVTGIFGPVDTLGYAYTTFYLKEDRIVVKKIEFHIIKE